MGLPLEGIRVIDLGQIFAAPYCTLQLAQMGAEIIKVEPPGVGESLRRAESSPGGVGYSFLMLNANKRSVTLNLKHPRGREIILKLIERADVLVENYSAGVMESFGLGYEDLRGRFPRLVYASAKGYASDGPWARLGAMDSTVQASSGFMSVTGYPDRSGVKTPATFIDMSTGSHLVSGILAALLQRERTGRGGTVKVSLFDALAEWMSNPLQQARLTGKAPERTGARHATILPYGGYLTADGDEVMLAVQNEAEWARLCRDVLGVPDMLDGRFAGNQRRMEHREEVEQRLAAAVARLSTRVLLDRLERAGLPYASAKSVQEVVDHPQLASRWTPVAAGDRSIDVLPPPVRHGGFGPVLGPVPAHGRDTEGVLAEFTAGLDAPDAPDPA